MNLSRNWKPKLVKSHTPNQMVTRREQSHHRQQEQEHPQWVVEHHQWVEHQKVCLQSEHHQWVEHQQYVLRGQSLAREHRVGNQSHKREPPQWAHPQ